MRKFLLAAFLLVLIFSFVLTAKVLASDSSPGVSPQSLPSFHVYYFGPHDRVYTALGLYPGFIMVEQPAQAQVLVFNGTIPENVADFVPYIQKGTGLLLLLGADVTEQEVSTLVGGNISLGAKQNAVSLIKEKSSSDPLATEIVWNSAPQIRDRYTLLSPLADLMPIVSGYETQEFILGSRQVDQGLIFVFTPFLVEANSQFQEWAYFNYLIYHLTARAAGGAPLTFASYPASPVPHRGDRTALLIILGGMLAFVLVVFTFVRRHSLAHPEALDALVVNYQEFESRQAKTDWNDIGFHRPLGGFMLALMLGLVLFIPLIIYQNLILPVYILPSAQALGIWGRVVQFFNFLWLFLDMGTSAAFIKFFSQYRVRDPRKAIQYGQVFVWWQALSGAIQVGLVAALAGTFLPQTAYAIYTWSVIIHTFIQIPGFYQVMRHGLMAWQRFDYAQILDLGLALIFPIIAQPLIVTLMVVWGRAHPIFGTAMGGLLGLGMAAYASEALTFLLGLWLYRRLGYNAKLLFLAHFDWETVKSAFRFGVFEMLGSVAWALGQAMEVLITQTRLVNYTEIWGNWVLAQNFIYAFNVIQTLYGNLMPSISEAISSTRKILSQYYSAMAYKWGGIISAFIGAVLLAVADRFILGASGPEFTRAATYAIPLIIWGSIQYPSWIGDEVQLASNRPYLKASMVAGEQCIRVLLAWLLLERFQITALIIAYFIGLLSKGLLAYFINHRLCYPQRFYFWQSLAAPLLAGASHYFILRWVTGLIWQGDQITSVLIFLIGILISYPLYAFLYGLFGGWDDGTLDELRHATELSNFMRPFARLFWASTALGARLSPLYGRFPIEIRPSALDEAQSLMQERVEI
jgi:O-antigen/teichoic acid export membrane protein